MPAKRARKRAIKAPKNLTPLLIIAGGAVLASALAGGIKANVQTPSIILNPPAVHLSFPSFSFPEIPGNLIGSGGSAPINIFNQQPPAIPGELPSIPTNVPPSFSFEKPVLPVPNYTVTPPKIVPEVIPFQAIAAKTLIGQTAFDFGNKGAFEFFSKEEKPLESFAVAAGSTAAASEIGFLGLSISKAGFNEASAGKAAILGKGVLGTADDVGRIARGGFLGGIGLPITLAAGGFTAGETVGAVRALKNEPSAATATGAGASIGSLGFIGAELASFAGISGFSAAPGLIAAGATSIAFSGAGAVGGLGGLGIDQFLTTNFPTRRTPEGIGAESPLSFAALTRGRDSSPSPFTANNPFSGRGFRANPGPGNSNASSETGQDQNIDNGETLSPSSTSDTRSNRSSSQFLTSRGMPTQRSSFTPGAPPARYAEALIRLRRGGFR